MFCGNCGKNIEDDSIFCVHCGKPIGAKTSTATKASSGVNIGKVNFEELGQFVLSLIKKPMDTMANLNKLSDLSAWILGGIVSLISVIQFFILKSVVIGKVFDTIYKAMNTIDGYGYYGNDMSSYGSEIASQIFKGQNGKLFFGMLLSSVLVLAVGALVIFALCKVVFKKDDYKYIDGIKVMVSAYTYTVVLTFVAILLFVISINLGWLAFGVISIVNVILIYKGVLGQGVCDDNKSLYVSILTMVVNTGVQYVVVTSLMKSIFKSLMGGMF